jgi:hypothetical protein
MCKIVACTFQRWGFETGYGKTEYSALSDCGLRSLQLLQWYKYKFLFRKKSFVQHYANRLVDRFVKLLPCGRVNASPTEQIRVLCGGGGAVGRRSNHSQTLPKRMCCSAIDERITRAETQTDFSKPISPSLVVFLAMYGFRCIASVSSVSGMLAILKTGWHLQYLRQTSCRLSKRGFTDFTKNADLRNPITN